MGYRFSSKKAVLLRDGTSGRWSNSEPGWQWGWFEVEDTLGTSSVRLRGVGALGTPTPGVLVL